MELSWLKPNFKGLVILAGVLIILATLLCLFGRRMPVKMTHHGSDGSIYETYTEGQHNRQLIHFAIITILLSYPISMCIGQGISSKPDLDLTMCSVITQGFFVTLALAGLGGVALFAQFGLLGPLYSVLVVLFSIPVVIVFLGRLRRSHPAASSISGIVLCGLLCAGLFWVYYTRPFSWFLCLSAASLSVPLFVLAILGFRKTTVTLYLFSLLILTAVYYVPWDLRSGFLRDLDSIKRGMTYAQVEKTMEKYRHRKWFSPLDKFSVKCLVPQDGKSVPLAAGTEHLVVIKPDGSLDSRGSNKSGECDVPSGNDFVAVGVGCSFSVALKSDGSLAAWGSNKSGRCDVPSGNDYTAVAAGHSHVVALKKDGSLVAWGRNNEGQCDVPPGNNFTAIAAGGRHSIGLRSDGSLAAWGLNDSGQCNVPSGKRFAVIAAGGSHSLALKSNGSVVSWGGAHSGWWDILAGRRFTAVAAGAQHNAALKSDGSLFAWGGNIYGHCDVPTGRDFVAVAAGFWNSTAIRRDGSLVVWGIPYTTAIDHDYFKDHPRDKVVNGTVLYHHSDNAGDSDIGRVRFRAGRVESVIFWPD